MKHPYFDRLRGVQLGFVEDGPKGNLIRLFFLDRAAVPAVIPYTNFL
jgi:hypothetical protein